MSPPAHIRRLDYKKIAVTLDVHERKASQAVNPAIDKVARLLIDFPAETMGNLAMAMAMVIAEREASGAPRLSRAYEVRV